VTYPVCIKGRRNTPPENSGGPWDYARLLTALRNLGDEERSRYPKLIGGFDSEEFDFGEIDRKLARFEGFSDPSDA
jgi:hypothetical protein